MVVSWDYEVTEILTQRSSEEICVRIKVTSQAHGQLANIC